MLGQILKKERMKGDLSQKDISEKLGYRTPQFVHMMENGKVRAPISSLRKIAKVYGVPFSRVRRVYIKDALTKIEDEVNSI